MANTNKPSHTLVRYYGTGDNASRATVGAIWEKDDGSLAIRLDTLTDQIWLHGFKIKENTNG